jgi:hypothetical protein
MWCLFFTYFYFLNFVEAFEAVVGVDTGANHENSISMRSISVKLLDQRIFLQSLLFSGSFSASAWQDGFVFLTRGSY